MRLQFATLILVVAALVPLAGFAAQESSEFVSLKEIRERGVVMQQWENSCAAASVATVLTYGFNDPVGERTAAVKMLELSNPEKVRSQGGFSLLDLKKFVEYRGFVGSAYKNLGFDDLRVFHAPIVPIDAHGYNHYVVFNGVRGDEVLIADPAYGNREIDIEQFKKLWIGGMAFVVTRPGPRDPATLLAKSDSPATKPMSASKSGKAAKPAVAAGSIYIQVAAFEQGDRIEPLLSRLSDTLGIDRARTRVLQVNSLNKVQVGPYANSRAAEIDLARLRSKLDIDKAFLTRDQS